MQGQDVLPAEAPLNLRGLLHVFPKPGLRPPGNRGIFKKSKTNPQ